MSLAFIPEQDLQSFRQEECQFARDILRIGFAEGPRRSLCKQWHKRDPRIGREQCAEDPQRRPPQSKRILRPRRLLINREEPDQRIQLVGQRHRHRQRRGRHGVRRTLRLVVVPHSIGDGVRIAGGAGVIAAHDPLQFGELPDHGGRQVSLGQLRGGLRLIRISPHQRRDLARQRRDPLDPLGQRPQLRMEGHPLQLLRPDVEAGLQVLVPEEAGVIQTGRQHAAVAGGQRLAAVGRLDIGHHHEMRRQPVFRRIAHREIFLVHLHRQPDHLGRQAEEGRVHVAENGRRPFGQPRHLVQQTVVIDESQPAVGADLLRRLEDLQPPVGRVQQDEIAFQLGAIVGEILDRERPAAAEEAVPLGQRARNDAVDLERHDMAVEQGHDPLQRPHPAQRARTPAHRLGPGETPHDLVDHLRDQGGRRLALAAEHGEEHPIALDQLVLRQAGLPQEALQRLLRRIGPRALDLFLAVRRRRRQALDHQRQPPRPRESRQRLIRQPRGLQPLRRHPLKVTRRPALHAGRDLFGEQFEKKLGHQTRPLSCSTHSVAQALQRSRIRPM